MIVQGIARWAKVREDVFDKKFNKWTIDVILNTKAVNKLKEVGLKPKKNEDGEWVFKFKRARVRKIDGVAKTPPVVVDAYNKPFTGLIGNGSIVNIQFTPIKYKEYGGGITHDLQGVQVVELVSFFPADGEEFTALKEEVIEERAREVEEGENSETGDDNDENPFV